MTITINGTTKTLTTAQHLHVIVQSFCPQPKHILTELNGKIIPSDQWQETLVKDGDILELVTFVGGG